MVILNTEIIDDLKCCGNCKDWKCESAQCQKAKGYCKHWEQDKLKKSDREVIV